MLTGLPGTGKSTTVSKLEQSLEGYDVHRVLEIRRDMGLKRYDPAKNRRVKEELKYRVWRSLYDEHGRVRTGVSGVIMDGVNGVSYSRREIYSIASWANLDVIVLECECPEQEAKRRIRKRPKSQGQLTEPRRAAVYDKLAASREPIDEEDLSWPNVSYLVYDTQEGQLRRIQVQESATEIVNAIEGILNIHCQTSATYGELR